MEEDPIYSFKPIEDMKLRGTKLKKIVLVLVRVKFLLRCNNSISSLRIDMTNEEKEEPR